MEWFEVSLEEYKSLRSECIESIKTQQTTLNFATAIVGAVIISGFNFWDKSLLPDLIFLIFIPIIAYLSLIIWIGEVARMIRAGKFLVILENKISSAFVDHPDALSFENWLRNNAGNSKTNQAKWNYVAVIALLAFIAVSSIIVGNFKIIEKLDVIWILLLNLIEIIVLFVVFYHVYGLSKSFK